MQEPGSPLVPLDPSRFREMVEKQQHVATQQQNPSTPGGNLGSQQQLPNQYYRDNLSRTQSTGSVGSAESGGSIPPSQQDVGIHFQQQMSPQYSPHLASQQQRFWYPHPHSSPRAPYCGPPPSVPQPTTPQGAQPLTPQPVRTPQSVGSANSPRMAMTSSHTSGSQVMSPDMAQSSPGSGRSPMGSPIQPQASQTPATPQQARVIRPGMQQPTNQQPSPYQQQSQQQQYAPNYHHSAQLPTQPQQQQQPGAFSPNYSVMHVIPGGPQQQSYPRPYAAGMRPGTIVIQQQGQMQQPMVGGRPTSIIRHPQYIQRTSMIPVNRPGMAPLPQGYQDPTFRNQQPGQPFVQYGPGQQQHPMAGQHPAQYGRPPGFPQTIQVSYANVASDGSNAANFGNASAGQMNIGQQRYPVSMQQQQQPGMLSPRHPGQGMIGNAYGPPTTVQQYYGPVPQQRYSGAGLALPAQQATAAAISPVAATTPLQSPVMVQQGQQQSQQPQTPTSQQAPVRFQQMHQQQQPSNVLYSPQLVLQQQVRGSGPPIQQPPQQQHQQLDVNQQMRQQGVFSPISGAMQQQPAQQAIPARVVHPGTGQPLQQPQQEMKVQYFGHEPHVPVPADMCLVGGVFLIVDYDRILDQKEVGDWKLVITLNAGEVETSYTSKCTHIICESLRHPVVQQALKEGKRCVTAQWLNDCLLQKKLQPPWKAVHFPSPYGDNKPCKNKIFTVCGFDANERSCLKQMIMAVGGKYTSYLSRHNSFLIAKCLEDIKVQKALEWKIQIVNVHFLTELFLGQGAVLQNVVNPKYHQFLPRELLQQQHPNAVDPFRIDPSMLPPLMSAWRNPITFTADCWKTALDRKQKLENDDGKMFPYKKLKLSPAPEDSEIENHRRSLASRGGVAMPKICFTGLYPAEVDNLTRKALWLGGDIVSDVSSCTHLVACDLKRTQKLLDGMALGKFIVTPLWIRQSYKQQQFVDAVEYLVKDEGNEKFFGFNLKLSIYRARQSKLFQNVVFYLTPSVQPYPSVLREMIQTAGGSVVPQRPPTKKILELQQQGVQLVVITCDNDLHLCQSLLDAGIAVHSAEFVLTGILRQEVDFTSYKIELRQNETAAKAARDA